MVRRKAGTLLPFELDVIDATLLLQDADDGAYGFRIAKELEAAGSVLSGYGTLYKALGRLATGGILEAVWEDAAVAETSGRPRRRLYRVTSEGLVLRASERERLRSGSWSPAIAALRSA